MVHINYKIIKHRYDKKKTNVDSFSSIDDPECVTAMSIYLPP